MTVPTMRDSLIVTLLTVLYSSSVQARSISKELLELNSHINTQFGFDYSNDAEFFSLIGVEAKLGESENESFSYEYYDYVPFDKNGKESEDEYDEGERNAGVNGVVEEVGDKESIQSGGKGKQEKGRFIITEYEDSDEYDENGFNYNNDSQENNKINDNVIFVQSEEKNPKNKDNVDLNNDTDDNYVNDYDETHEITSNEDNSGDIENEEEEEEEEYDEDYDYEGDESEERNERYYDSEEDETNNEEYIEDEEDEDDHYEDYDYSEEKDNEKYDNANKDEEYGNVMERAYKQAKSVHVNKNKEHNEVVKSEQNNAYEAYDESGELGIGDDVQNVSNDARKRDYSYEDYDNFKNY